MHIERNIFEVQRERKERKKERKKSKKRVNSQQPEPTVAFLTKFKTLKSVGRG
jgi:hypothetical protein